MSATPATEHAASGTEESFAALFEESVQRSEKTEGSVVEGRVIALDNDMAVIDVGLKAEGRVPLKEFSAPGESPDLSIGDTVEVFLERIENRRGEAVLSRERARREEAWVVLEKAFSGDDRVEGTIFARVKGGFTVDLGGAVAFLPGSQVDVRPVRDITPLLNTKQPFQILKMDRRRGNIVVSRRAVMEETRAEARAALVASLREGQILEGVVKNITDYGAFVDLGEVDGLLHVTDMAWRRVNHPTEVLSIGQQVKVQVIRFNVETQRISLGMKQLEADPWEGVELKYPVSAKFRGRVTNITDYGAFVELEPGVEGLVHVSEMSWTKKNVHPGKIVSTSQEVEVMVLDVDPHKRRISLGLKQCIVNPWEAFSEQYAVDSPVEGEVRNITEFGLFVGLDGGIDGLVHLSDLDWDRPGEEAIKDYRKGQRVRARVLDIDAARERIGLGIKQLASDPFASATADVRRGAAVTGTVSAIRDNGIEGDGEQRRGRVHPQGGTGARPLAPAPRPLRGRRPGGRPDHPDRQRRAPPDHVDQGAGDRRGKTGDGGIRLVGQRRQPRRHSRRRVQGQGGSRRRREGRGRHGRQARARGRRRGLSRRARKLSPPRTLRRRGPRRQRT